MGAHVLFNLEPITSTWARAGAGGGSLTSKVTSWQFTYPPTKKGEEERFGAFEMNERHGGPVHAFIIAGWGLVFGNMSPFETLSSLSLLISLSF